MSVRTRKLLELAVEIAVPIALVALIWAYTESSETFYYPPLGDVFEKFADNWLFDRVGSDVWPSLRRIAFGYAIAVVLGIAAGTALGTVTRHSRDRRPSPNARAVSVATGSTSWTP